MYVQTALKGVAELCWRELYIVMEIRKKTYDGLFLPPEGTAAALW